MKIGVLIDRLNVGGVEKVAIEEVRALRSLGVDAHLVVLRRRAVVEGAFEDLRKGVPIIYLDDRLPRFLKFSFRVPLFYFFSLFHLSYPLALLWSVKRHEYDFLVSHNSYTSFTAYTLSRWRAIPYAIYVWDPIASILQNVYVKGLLNALRFVTIPISQWIDKLLVKHAKAILVASATHYQYLEQITDRSKIHFAPPGRRYLDELPPGRGGYLLTVTAWKEGKQLEDLLGIVAELAGAELKVGGRWLHPMYRERIESLISQRGLSGRVEIVGEVNEDELDTLYANARATVIVNAERGFGLAGLEAAANGCPFIIPSECGVARFFEKDKDGFYFDHGDLSTLRQYVRKLLDDERLAYAMGKHAWEAVRSKYSWENHAKQLVAIVRGAT